MEPQKSKLFKNKSFGYGLLLPATILLLCFSIYPILNGIFISMTNRVMLFPDRNDFVFFENYARLMADEEFWGTLGFTFVYTASTVLFSYLLGLTLALILNRKIPGRAVFRTLFLLPWIIPSVVAMTNWSWLLNDQFGIINTTLQSIGIIDKPILFLADYRLIRITVIAISVWKAMPFMMISLLAGLQSVPQDLYEASSIDGAGFFATLRYITLPLIKPVSVVSITLSFIWTLNSFENIWLLTNGGPNGYTFTLPILSYYTAFFRQNQSYAATIATTMMLTMVLLNLFSKWVQKRSNLDAQTKMAEDN